MKFQMDFSHLELRPPSCTPISSFPGDPFPRPPTSLKASLAASGRATSASVCVPFFPWKSWQCRISPPCHGSQQRCSAINHGQPACGEVSFFIRENSHSFLSNLVSSVVQLSRKTVLKWWYLTIRSLERQIEHLVSFEEKRSAGRLLYSLRVWIVATYSPRSIDRTTDHDCWIK